jgi:predicted nicotinamide N-methyase
VDTIMTNADRRAFIRANTRVQAAPHVPEVRLHLADEAIALWQRTEDELAEIGLPPPFWAFAWAGGQALARYLIDHPEIVAGRTVLDLAAGCGIVAIAAMTAGAAAATATEIDAFALEAIALNAALNAVPVAVRGVDLLAGAASRDTPSAGSPAAAEAASAGAHAPEAARPTARVGTAAPVRPHGSRSFDVVLAGDVFYERALAERALAFLRAEAARGAAVLIGDPGRSYLPQQELEPVETYQIAVTRALEDTEIKRTTVWRLRSR